MTESTKPKQAPNELTSSTIRDQRNREIAAQLYQGTMLTSILTSIDSRHAKLLPLYILIFESGLEDAIREAPSSLIVSEGHKMLRL